MTAEERIADIRARLRNVAPLTSLPADRMPSIGSGLMVGAIGDVDLWSAPCHGVNRGTDEQIADLVTHAPEDLAWLCDEAERLRDEVERLRDVETAANAVLDLCSHRDVCPLCGSDGHDHKPGAVCDLLDKALCP